MKKLSLYLLTGLAAIWMVGCGGTKEVEPPVIPTLTNISDALREASAEIGGETVNLASANVSMLEITKTTTPADRMSVASIIKFTCNTTRGRYAIDGVVSFRVVGDNRLEDAYFEVNKVTPVQ